MDLPLVIRQRLKDLGSDQKDLAAAAGVTESYISQLLARKKTPPAPHRTDIYEKMGEFLRIPSGELSKLADFHRREESKKRPAEPPRPLFKASRDLILRKCDPGKRERIRATFEKEPFGELERLVTRKLLDVAKKVAKDELQDENWLREVARLSGRSYEQMRFTILEFLDTDVFSVSVENCVLFLDPLIESWEIDLETFGMDIVLNRRLAFKPLKRFEFVETEPGKAPDVEPGLEEFLEDKTLSGDVTDEEVEFLKGLKFRGRSPAPLYYYREVQNLRDPLHFRGSQNRRGGAPAARGTQVRSRAKRRNSSRAADGTRVHPLENAPLEARIRESGNILTEPPDSKE